MSEPKKSTHKPFLFILVGVVGLWLLGAGVTHFSPLSGTLEQRGAFGDSFGSINALFAGFAFAGVIYAILLQREELRLQRKELKMTREELSRSAKAQEAVSRTQRQSLEQQQQTAILSALTALLSWEMNQKDVVLPALARFGDSRGRMGQSEHLVRDIEKILAQLRRGN